MLEAKIWSMGRTLPLRMTMLEVVQISYEDTDHLLKAVKATMNLEDPRDEKSIQDRMFEKLESKHERVFPIHKNIWGLI